VHELCSMIDRVAFMVCRQLRVKLVVQSTVYQPAVSN
jgi:hypothetical protein